MQRWAESIHNLLITSEAQIANNNYFLSANKRDRGCRWLWGRFPRGEGPATHSQQVDYTGLMPAALGEGCKWVLPGIDASDWALQSELMQMLKILGEEWNRRYSTNVG